MDISSEEEIYDDRTVNVLNSKEEEEEEEDARRKKMPMQVNQANFYASVITRSLTF